MLYIFLMMLVGYRESDGLQQYQAAIESVTDDPEEQRLLGTVGRTENYFHLGSRTPPFGLTWESYHRQLRCRRLDVLTRQERRLGGSTNPSAPNVVRTCRRISEEVSRTTCAPPFTIGTGAAYALRSLRALRRTCAREVPGQPDTIEGRWLLALGRYHHGTGGPHHGCWADPLAHRQIEWMSTTPPRRLPRGAILFRTRRF